MPFTLTHLSGNLGSLQFPGDMLSGDEAHTEEEIRCVFDDNFKRDNFFLSLHKNQCCGCSLELPHRGDSNEHPQYRFL